MCGRYSIKNLGSVVAAFPEYADVLREVGQRFNVAPSQSLPVIASDGGRRMKWGLVPFWDKSEKPKVAPINARSEEVLTKPAFRQSVQRRRCLVVADGFYEWRKLDEHHKLPFHIQLRGGRGFAFAGIYEAATSLRPETFAILTTTPNALMEPIHNRMPVILDGEAAAAWLRPGELSADALARFVRPFDAGEIEIFAVTSIVNNPRNEVPECVMPVDHLELGDTSAPNSA